MQITRPSRGIRTHTRLPFSFTRQHTHTNTHATDCQSFYQVGILWIRSLRSIATGLLSPNLMEACHRIISTNSQHKKKIRPPNTHPASTYIIIKFAHKILLERSKTPIHSHVNDSNRAHMHYRQSSVPPSSRMSIRLVFIAARMCVSV